MVLRPAAWIRHGVRDLTVSQILAGTIGLVIGLLIAALVSIPLSSLPYPFGDILPTLAALFLGYVGITVMIMRQQDIFALFRRRGEILPGGTALAPDEGVVRHDAMLLLDTSVIIDGRIADIVRDRLRP